jgi:4-amino-4-deoxy-L-arabinose transferase-like glycosyltransferase
VLAAAVVLTAFAAVLLLLLGSPLDWSADEHLYINGGLAMHEGGSLFVPQYYHGAPRFQKPPLMYWLVFASYKLLGVSLFAGRLPAFFSSLLVLFFTWKLAGTGERAAERGRLAVVILAGSYLFQYFARSAVTDMAMAAGITGAAWFLFSYFTSGQAKRTLYPAALCAGLAAMAKGPVAFVLLAGGLLLYLFMERGRIPAELLRPGRWAGPLLLSLLVGGWWYLYMALAYGEAFLGHQVTAEVVHRTGGSFMGRAVNLAWYPIKLAVSMMPFTLAIFFFNRSDKERIFPESARFSVAFIIPVMVFYALFIDWRASRYMVPALPFVAVILAHVMASTGRNPAANRMMGLFRGFTTFVLMLTIVLSVMLLVMTRNDIDQMMTMKFIVLVLLLVVMCFSLFRYKGDINNMAALCALAMLAVFAVSGVLFKGTLRSYGVLDAARYTHNLTDKKVFVEMSLGSRDTAIMYFFGQRRSLEYKAGEGAELRLVRGDLKPGEGKPEAKFTGLVARPDLDLGVSDMGRILLTGNLLRELPMESYYLVPGPGKSSN